MLTRRRKTNSFERLESRYTLAGNVTAVVDGSGNLLIKGDNFDNGVHFIETSTGHYDLTGVNASGSATKINGVDNDTVHLSGISGSITFRMLAGNDSVTIPYFNYGGWLIINTGTDDDTVSLGDANGSPSFLLGTLSIRTFRGGDRITETNINGVGSQDFAADLDYRVSESENPDSIEITDSTFGAQLYADFGGHTGSLDVTNVNVAGLIDVSNERYDSNILYNAYYPVAVRGILQLNFSNSSNGGNFNVSATIATQLSLDHMTTLGAGTFTMLGSSNTFDIVDTSFASLTFDSKYDYPNIPVSIFFPAGSNYDVITVDHAYIGDSSQLGSMDLKAAGSISIDNTAAGTTSLATLKNAYAYMHVGSSAFQNLSVASGTPNAFESGGTTFVELIGTQIAGRLYFEGNTRVATSRVGQQRYININTAIAVFEITGCSIGFVEYATTNTEPLSPTFYQLGSMYFTFKNSVINSVNMDLPFSLDYVTFDHSNVAVSTILNGGVAPLVQREGDTLTPPMQLGTSTNYFYNIGSSLAGLVKSYFSN